MTFDDVDITTHQYYQGVFFQWGSLWGIAPNGTNGSGWNNIVYKLDGSGAHIKSTSAIGWNNTNIPRVDDTSKTSNPPAGKSARDRNYLYEITDGVSGKGDICKYLTEHAPGKLIHGKKWRMPTSSEFGVNANYSWSGSWSAVTSNNDAGVYNYLLEEESRKLPTLLTVIPLPSSPLRGIASTITGSWAAWATTASIGRARRTVRSGITCTSTMVS